VKVEKIPVLSQSGGTDGLKAEQTKDNSSVLAETSHNSDDVSKTSSEPAVPSASSVPSPHSPMLLSRENTLHLTAQVQDGDQIDAVKIQKEGSSSLDGKRHGPVTCKQSAGTEEKPSMENSPKGEEENDTEVITGLRHQPDEPQVKSTSTEAQLVHKSRESVDSVATAGKQSSANYKPKAVNIRRAADRPDQNCPTQ